MQEFNGHIFCRNSFTGYKLRATVQLEDTDRFNHNIDVYTDAENKEQISKAIENLATNKVTTFEIIHLATKEQDDKSTELINAFLDTKL